MLRGKVQVLGLTLVLGLTCYAVNGWRPEQDREMYHSVDEMGSWGRCGNEKAVNPSRRMEELIHCSESFGQIEPIGFRDWVLIELNAWATLASDALTFRVKPERVHGGVQ
jgi:hypothetical protein